MAAPGEVHFAPTLSDMGRKIQPEQQKMNAACKNPAFVNGLRQIMRRCR